MWLQARIGCSDIDNNIDSCTWCAFPVCLPDFNSPPGIEGFDVLCPMLI